MEHLLYQSSSQTALSIFDLMIGLSLSLILGTFLSFVYRFTHRGATFEKTFLLSLSLMAPVITLIIMFIGSNLTLSLGMVGALSIVRFRTAIKDSRDMLFLFLSIAIGLGCGTFNWKATVAGAIFFYIVMLVFRWTSLESAINQSYILTINADDSADTSAIRTELDKIVNHIEVRSIETKSKAMEIVYEIKSFKNEYPAEKIVAVCKGLKAVKEVTLLTPQIRLPI